MTIDRTKALDSARRILIEAETRNQIPSWLDMELVARALLAEVPGEEITPKCAPHSDMSPSEVPKEITPSSKEVRAVVVAIRDATSTFISAGTLRKMAHDAIRAFRLVQSPANPLYGASALSPTVRDVPQDKSDDCYTGKDQ